MINMNAIQELVTSWFNPTALFCIVNLMIGAIFILMTQNKHGHSNIQENQHLHHHQGPEFARVPSLFERVRSFNLSKNWPEEPERAKRGPDLERVPSFFERGWSFNLSKNHTDEPEHGEPGPELVRVPSFFERVRSFNLSKNRPAEPEQDEPSEPRSHQHGGDVNEPEESGGVIVNKVLKKSASERVAATEEDAVERRRPETSRERAEADDEAVDAKADDFINRFKQQLKMQRLDSIMRYKEMLNRGASW